LGYTLKIHYVSCFRPDDQAELPLRTELQGWKSRNDIELTHDIAQDAENLREHLKSLANKPVDVLIVGGHGHGSLSGFLVGDDPVRWHDLACLLRGTLSKTCTFIFYSCNGGYPGINPVLDHNFGPDFVFGPYISVEGAAMTHAITEILTWKLNGGGDAKAASTLVDRVNSWASTIYNFPYEQSFLRVIWRQGRKIRRHPNRRSSDKVTKPLIKLRGWGQPRI
jgi:hypothetical protein